MSKPSIVLVHGFWGASLASQPVAVADLIDQAATSLAGQ